MRGFIFEPITRITSKRKTVISILQKFRNLKTRRREREYIINKIKINTTLNV